MLAQRGTDFRRHPLTSTRFQVATSASGQRRTIDVWVYDTLEELRAAAHRFNPLRSFIDAAGCFQHSGYRWPSPEQAWFGIIRLYRGQLTTETIAHESTHAAAEIYFADCTQWDSRARAHFRGDNEPLAYMVGQLASRITAQLYRIGALT